jgi:uncharacterized protein
MRIEKEDDMRGYSRKLMGTTLFIVMAMGACVTINIYFPAEKVESVAGEIVQEIRGKQNEAEKPPEKNKQGALMEKALFAWGPSTAWAADVTGVSNPTIRALKERMKARYAQMKPHYQQGMFNEGNDGFVSIAKTDGLNLKQQRDLKGLVEAENSDRGQLYDAIAKALNIDPGQINRVSEIFAKEWQKTAR